VSSTQIDLTIANNGTLVTAAVQDTIIITLKGNPTTGHKWNTYAVFGQAVLENGAPTYTPDRSHPGAGGIYQFPFIAAAGGDGEVRLVEGRDWESRPIAAYVVKFRVQ